MTEKTLIPEPDQENIEKRISISPGNILNIGNDTYDLNSIYSIASANGINADDIRVYKEPTMSESYEYTLSKIDSKFIMDFWVGLNKIKEAESKKLAEDIIAYEDAKKKIHECNMILASITSFDAENIDNMFIRDAKEKVGLDRAEIVNDTCNRLDHIHKNHKLHEIQ